MRYGFDRVEQAFMPALKDIQKMWASAPEAIVVLQKKRKSATM
jgi:hypothetical protein